MLSVADFPLTTGRTDHSFLAASINSGESAIWPKLLLFLWAQELGFVEVASGDGQMEVSNQKLVEDHLESDGNCDPEMTRNFKR